MRVLLAHKLWEVTGGAEVFFRETERVLREAGHETWMVATGTPSPDDPGNLTLLRAPAYDSGGALARMAALPSAIYDRQKRSAFAQVIEDFRPDVFHMFALNVHLSLSPIDAAVAAGVPIVATFNDYKHICPNYKLFADGRICYACKGRKFRNAAIKACCKDSRALSVASMLEAEVHRAMGLYEKIDHFTFSSDFMAARTAEFWPDGEINWSKLRNPFDSARHPASSDYEPFGLYFGRLIGEKGVDRILDAASDIGGFPIKIVGNGPDEAKLRQRAAAEKLGNVEFLGPMWGAPLAAILARASFVIVPSIWHENFPYVINQAFAFGRPVIGSDRGGITELVDHGTRGLVFDPDAPGALAASIRRLVADPDLTVRMGRAAKVWSDRTFNDATVLGELEEAYARARDAFRRNRR